jgi:hypothetical protein
MGLVDKNSGGYAAKFNTRLAAFTTQVETAARKAAIEADRISKRNAKGIRAPQAPRPYRTSPPGALAKNIDWKVDPTDSAFVQLDTQRLDSVVRWWKVQEIGTGKSAVIRKGGKPNPQGRVPKGANYKIQIKSQKGRIIPGTLVFVARNGNAQRFSDRSKRQALVERTHAKNATRFPINPVRIRNEIEGKHFIRDGAREGFRDYRNDVIAAARATLGTR